MSFLSPWEGSNLWTWRAIRCRCRLVGAILAAWAIASSGLAQDDPFTTPTPSVAQAMVAGWSAATIPVKASEKVFFGPRGCPVVLVGKRVMELADLKVRCELTGELPFHLLAALSDNGQYVALGNSIASDSAVIRVVDTTNNSTVLEVPQARTASFFMRISLNKYVIANATTNNSLDVWSIASGKKVKSIPVDTNLIQADKIDLSGDGKHYCFVAHEGPVICSTSTGKEVSRLAMSGDAPAVSKGKRGLPSPAKDPEAFRAALKARSQAVFGSAWTQSLSFSPDGDEVAAYTSHPNPRLLCWNNQGKMVEEIPIPDISRVSESSFYWLPEKAGWIVNGLLVDRASKRTVLQFRGSSTMAVLDKDRLVGRMGDRDAPITQFTIPWTDLRKAVQALNAKTPAILAPYQPVSLDVKVEQTRGDAAEFARLVREAMTKRLQRDGIQVREGQPTVIRVVVSEKAGEQIPIFERNSRFDFRGRDTGRKVAESEGAASIEILVAGQADPLWRDSLRSSSARNFDKEITDETVRESMVQHMTSGLNRLSIPYFIPQAEDILALPTTVE
ncbi:MAG: WD40 repeat domain-containing protein [Pirellulales bacterium]